MSLRTFIALVVLGPITLVAGLIALGVTIPIPEFGRDYVLRLLLPDYGEEIDLPQIYGASDETLPLVVIDAGHGGRDPGAVGDGIFEKDITLGLALALRDAIAGQGGVRVALTREDDRLLSLDERPDIASQMQADMFISIHADSAGEFTDVSGASIYTLSREASSRAAARFALRENDADRLNGISVEGQSDDVTAILFELSQRRVQDESANLSALILREGDGRIEFHPQPKRSANLSVLREPELPAILFEAGFVTNNEDAQRLLSEEGQTAFANVMARAIRIHFASRSQN
ncbi:MAG: N-acetylmuramoyl-L-alanine amidase [Erythrobacter sp.]